MNKASASFRTLDDFRASGEHGPCHPVCGHSKDDASDQRANQPKSNEGIEGELWKDMRETETKDSK
jgi:hypothetical protein